MRLDVIIVRLVLRLAVKPLCPTGTANENDAFRKRCLENAKHFTEGCQEGNHVANMRK